jgi:hypothetical protein
MTVFFWGMAAGALVFWGLGVIWDGGVRGLMAAMGPGPVAAFVAAHIPAAVVGVLLWQWQRHGMPARRRVMLEAATVYFLLTIAVSIFLNVLLVSAMGGALAPVMPRPDM